MLTDPLMWPFISHRVDYILTDLVPHFWPDAGHRCTQLHESICLLWVALPRQVSFKDANCQVLSESMIAIVERQHDMDAGCIFFRK